MTVVRSVWRFVDWVLRLDVVGSAPVFEMECTSCGAGSEASESAVEPQMWALGHAGRSGHTGFRAVHTSFFRATPAGERSGDDGRRAADCLPGDRECAGAPGLDPAPQGMPAGPPLPGGGVGVRDEVVDDALTLALAPIPWEEWREITERDLEHRLQVLWVRGADVPPVTPEFVTAGLRRIAEQATRREAEQQRLRSQPPP
ncbi:hypothetical protein GCM10009544_13760 [Streptomyces stramineus]|uniref:DUF7848 domain-containing protein n=1 Tax=Streptomyces stramineus TaxID=173861 RepID=A0ABN0ZLT6_9ACTN